jgi:hypothetical protein
MSDTVMTARAPTTAPAGVPPLVDWEQYNLECPEEDVPPGWISSDEGNYDTDEQTKPTPPATCASCHSPLVLHANLHSNNGRVVCPRTALLPPITIKRGRPGPVQMWHLRRSSPIPASQFWPR